MALLRSSFAGISVALLLLLLAGCSTTKKSIKPPPDTKNLPERQFRQEVVHYALQFVGTSYKYAGTDPKTGFDCSGFTKYVLQQFDIRVSPASSAQSREGQPVVLSAVQPGDILVFGKNKKDIQHVALVVERSNKGIICVHSTTSRGVIRENISASAYWTPLILFARDMISSR